MWLQALLLPVVLAYPARSDVVEENISGYKFIHSGPTYAAPKSTYENYFCHVALSKLDAPDEPDATCVPKLQALKATYTPDQFLTHFTADNQAADATWHAVVANSTGKSHVSANADIVAVVPNITALSFSAYYISAYATSKYLEINPEHYIFRPNGTGADEVLEGWGGVTTHFTLAATDRSAYTYLPPLSDFPIKSTSNKVLRDGTGAIFGVVDTATKDVVGPEAGLPVGEKGVHVKASVWYGDGAPASFVEMESRHVVVEIINHMLEAKKGYDSGAIVYEDLVKQLCAFEPTLPGCPA